MKQQLKMLCITWKRNYNLKSRELQFWKEKGRVLLLKTPHSKRMKGGSLYRSRGRSRVPVEGPRNSIVATYLQFLSVCRHPTRFLAIWCILIFIPRRFSQSSSLNLPCGVRYDNINSETVADLLEWLSSY